MIVVMVLEEDDKTAFLLPARAPILMLSLEGGEMRG